MPVPHDNATFETADSLTPQERVAVWNAGFAGYYVDVRMTEEKLAQHVRRAGVSLGRSLVLSAGGERIGFSFLAEEPGEGGLRGWIGGFGISPAQRGRGWSGRLIEEQLVRALAAGFCEIQLEVIERNPARRVYGKAGFEEEALLESFSGVPDPAWAAHGMPLARLAAADVADWHGLLHRGGGPTWRRDLPTLRRILAEEPRVEAWAVEYDEGYPACALVLPGSERIQILDAAATGRDAAHDLLAGLARIHPGRPFLLVDEPEDSPLAKTCTEFGLREAIRQVRMRWRPRNGAVAQRDSSATAAR